MTIQRITALMSTRQVLTDINRDQNSLATIEQQLSTGRRISQPSDDPYGASVAIQLRGEISRRSDYDANITDGNGWLQTANAALGSIENETQRVRELAVQAANGTNSQADLTAIADEISQLAGAVKQQANTQYAGQYVFAGTATTTPPYTSSDDLYRGNLGIISRQVGSDETVRVNVDLSSALGSGADGKLLDVLNRLASGLASGTASGISPLPEGALTALDSGLAALQQLQAAAGAAQTRLQLTSRQNQALETVDQSALSDAEDADMAATILAFSNQQAALTAALKVGASIVQSSLLDYLR